MLAIATYLVGIAIGTVIAEVGTSLIGAAVNHYRIRR